jgi:predicted nuclease with TOPRIM domain
MQYMNLQLKAAEDEIQQTRRQKFVEQNECHLRLLKELESAEEFSQSVNDQIMGLQQRNMELSQQLETLSGEVENKKSEVANLNKALDITAEDRQRKKPRRGKMSGEKT